MNYTVRNLLVAAVLMLVGILAVTSFLRAERKDLEHGKQQIQVLVAAKDIPAGTSAKDLEKGGYLTTTDVLREDAPPNAIGKISSLKVDKKWLISNDTVYKDEVLTTRSFDDQQGLAPTHAIKGNERLFAVPVQASSDAAGLIRQGDHVDILAALKVDGSQSVAMTVVARDVEVIETPQSLTPKGIEIEQTAPDAEGDTKLYVLKGTDREWQNIQLANATSDNFGLLFGLRPSNGDTESNLPPVVGVLNVPEQGVKAVAGPDPAVR
jgi:pilus assembly protein CpaB